MNWSADPLPMRNPTLLVLGCCPAPHPNILQMAAVTFDYLRFCECASTQETEIRSLPASFQLCHFHSYQFYAILHEYPCLDSRWMHKHMSLFQPIFADVNFFVRLLHKSRQLQTFAFYEMLDHIFRALLWGLFIIVQSFLLLLLTERLYFACAFINNQSADINTAQFTVEPDEI